MDEDTGTFDIPFVSMRELRQSGELPATKEGLAIELALRVGELMSSSGAGAKDTVLMMRRVCQAYGLSQAQLDITSNVIMASYYPGDGLGSITSFRAVAPTVPNLSTVSTVTSLVNQITEGMGIERATRHFDRAVKAKAPYPAWLSVLAAGGISGSVQLFYTTDPLMILLAFLMGLVINRFANLLARSGLPTLFQQLFSAWLIVAIAAGTSWIDSIPLFDFLGYLSPTMIAVGCVFQLVAGARFVAGIQDAIDDYPVTATARILQVVMLTSGLVVGLVSGLGLARRIGIDVYISSAVMAYGPIPAQIAAAVLTATFSALSTFANPRTLIITAVSAGIGWGVYVLALQARFGAVAANFAGPMVAALLVTILVRRLRQIPAFGVINAVGIPFVPGLTLYLGLLQLVGSASTQANLSQGGATLGTAVAVALAIAAGASLGIFLGRPVSEKLMAMPRPWQRGRKQAALPHGRKKQ